MTNDLLQIGAAAKEASGTLQVMGSALKDDVLRQVAHYLVEDTDLILKANEEDMARGRENHMPEGLLDRLLLTPGRIAQMAEGLCQIALLEDPIGEVLSMKNRPNGLRIGKKRVPLGVVGIIYEARPNVTADAFGLCFKTGNAVILKGGSDAISSNIAIVESIRRTLRRCQVTPDAIGLITDTNRETATAFMQMNEYLDVLIPRVEPD